MNKDNMSLISPKVLATLSDDEKHVLADMLSELSEGQPSDTMNNLWKQDYDEIPVDIDTFLEDDEYLGTSTNNGNSIYPFWRKHLRSLFAPGAPYVECLVGDTMIPLLSGDTVPISSLVNNYCDQYTYSYDTIMHTYVPGKITDARCMGLKDVYRVILDNNEELQCTNNHKFMMRDGSYKYLRDLDVGSSLMPFEVTFDKDDYEHISVPISNSKLHDCPTHRLVAMWKYGYLGRNHHEVHHKDHNPHNNSPSNLCRLTIAQHRHYHACEGNRLRWSDPNQVLQASIRMRKHNLENNNASKIARKYWDNISDTQLAERSARMGNYNSTKHPNLRADITIDIVIQALKSNHTLSAAASSVGCSRSRIYKVLGAHNLNYKDYLANNHKIVSIEYVGKKLTYDLEVEHYHNFALKCGIVVHNCIYSGAIG